MKIRAVLVGCKPRGRYVEAATYRRVPALIEIPEGKLFFCWSPLNLDVLPILTNLYLCESPHLEHELFLYIINNFPSGISIRAGTRRYVAASNE
jgi:hypothetical protein